MYDYIKHLQWAKLKVGIVITVAIAVVFMAVMFAGDIEKMFSPKVTIYAKFSDVKGLRKGSPVWFSGVEIGSVKKIGFTIERSILVEMTLSQDSLRYLKKNSVADILTLGLLGDKYIELTPGTPDESGLQPGDTIIGTSHVEIQDVVETGQKSIASFSEFINTLEEVLSKIESGEGTVSKFIKDPSIYDNLKNASAELTDLIRKVKEGSGTVSKLLYEDELYRNVSASARKLKEFSSELAESNGTIHGLIRDDTMYRNFTAASARLDRLLERIEKGEGTIGDLMKDQEMAMELKSTLHEMRSLIKDIREHPGRYFKFSIF
jgi:phospholipid/cholesterol/gamma-HCH transport system substrate-binding protein